MWFQVLVLEHALCDGLRTASDREQTRLRKLFAWNSSNDDDYVDGEVAR
jgi:hypothetical protein